MKVVQKTKLSFKKITQRYYVIAWRSMTGHTIFGKSGSFAKICQWNPEKVEEFHYPMSLVTLQAFVLFYRVHLLINSWLSVSEIYIKLCAIQLSRDTTFNSNSGFLSIRKMCNSRGSRLYIPKGNVAPSGIIIRKCSWKHGDFLRRVSWGSLFHILWLKVRKFRNALYW